MDETAFLRILVEQQGEQPYLPLSTNLGLKIKRRILYFPMDFGELTLDGLIDTGAHSSAIPEADLSKIRLLVPQSIVKEGPAPSFQILVANGDLETHVLTKKPYSPRHAPRHTKFSLFLNAIENGCPQILERHGTHPQPRGCNNSAK